ncbi:MAG: 2,4-dihydroxyhept-2-ene-1,7-dioic acid aldolase [Betaproteobacteria bacterium]|nr:MAG: 2,4-dihydroxyhept-2-ene-1,7-dioic acid aldolase [Betaproteobacteria bacterium]
MRPNPVRERLEKSQTVLGTMCSLASPLMAEALGHAGYDFLIVDLQHGESNLGDAGRMLQAVSATPATPLVRVPDASPMLIQRVLDLGAYGVIVPMVETRQQAQDIVRAVRYAPHGARSWGPIRGTLFGGGDYFARAHEVLLTLVMLETARGAADAAAILSVEGIDGCFVGPNDLSISMGHGPEQPALAGDVETAIAGIAADARRAGKAAGIQVYTADAARHRIEGGFRLISVQSDIRMARAAARDVLGRLRGSP